MRLKLHHTNQSAPRRQKVWNPNIPNLNFPTRQVSPFAPGRTQATNDGNGTSTNSSEADISPAEINTLREELSALRSTVLQQQQLVAQQQISIDLLQRYMKGRSPIIEELIQAESQASKAIQSAPISDRRALGMFDARFHSASSGATPTDCRILPRRIILVRHAESEGNVNDLAYTYLPDPRVPLTDHGWEQAVEAGEELRKVMEADGTPYNVTFLCSPYLRSRETYEGIVRAFPADVLSGAYEDVQLREQDFGNFQDAEGKQREKADRVRFGRFFYRFPNGESGADVYDRMTLFEDHLVRDINAGRFAKDSNLILVTHGLALRVFLMRWFHWTVDEFLAVFNPPNATPIILERFCSDVEGRNGGPAAWMHTKALYRLSSDSMELLKGCTGEMCSDTEEVKIRLSKGLTDEEVFGMYSQP
jgi:broad specificity phosphatase PhoE